MLIFGHLFKATTLRSLIMTLGQACFIPYSMKMTLYDGPTIIAPGSMKQQVSGRPKSTRLHNEMDVREGKPR